MPYQFHTTLPIRASNDLIEDIWVCAELSWDQHQGSPRITSFSCDDVDIMGFWHSENAPSLEMAIIDDALRLHYAHTELQ